MDARHTIAERPMPIAGLYHGWLIVGMAFLVALFGFGLGFYGPGIYLVELRARFGWSAADIATAISLYYVLGATLLFFFVGGAFERYGVRRVVTVGALALAAGLAALTRASELWHVHIAFAVMSAGWATMSGAAINIIVAPWFDRRRGLAVSIAANGGSAGGVVMAPLLVFLIGRFGFAAALPLAGALMLAVLLPLLVFVAREKRPGDHDLDDGPPAAGAALSTQQPPRWSTQQVLRDPKFITISIPFALGLTAQVGFLTHQVAFLIPATGPATAGSIVSLTTFAAIIGRLVTGLFIDRVDRRLVSCQNFLLQVAAMAILMAATSPALLLTGCVLFGLGLGNMTSLPALIVQQEFPTRDFARIVSMIVAINQFTFAFGPALIGLLQGPDGAYTHALLACLVMQVLGAVIVLAPVIGRSKRTP